MVKTKPPLRSTIKTCNRCNKEKTTNGYCTNCGSPEYRITTEAQLLLPFMAEK